MKNFFGRREETEEENREAGELEIIDLDETSGWSKFDVMQELKKQQAEGMMEEIGDELAIIDVLENDVSLEAWPPLETERKPQQKAERTGKETAKGPKNINEMGIKENDTEHPDAEESHREEVLVKEITLEDSGLEDPDLEDPDLEDLDLEEVLLEEGIEYLSMEEEDEAEEEEDDEKEDASPFAFFETIADWLSGFTVMDKMVAVIGILVLSVAVLTAFVYTGKRGVNKQMEAFAPIGQQLESVGVVGSDKLLAVADAKKAMLEAAKLEEELHQEYEEEELSKEVKVVMKMTSVQKDLKIKFVNKKTGKLVGNLPFEVKITDAENKTYHKIDEDKDGIIYLTDLVPGNYEVSMVELSGVEGYSFSTGAEKIKVKETIAYEKIDVTEEIKDQSQVDVSKEDTAQKTETEAALADTVEWVESSKKETKTQETYTKVNKDTIADPALSTSLKLDMTVLRALQQPLALAGNILPLTEGSVSENTPAPPVTATGISLSASSISLKAGETQSLAATVVPEDAGNKEVTWSCDNSGAAQVGSDGTVTAIAKGEATITATVVNSNPTISASCKVTVTEKVVAVETKITLSQTTLSLEAGKEAVLTAKVEPEGKSVSWTSSDSKVATVENGKVKAVSKGTAVIKAAVTTENNESKSAECTVTVSEAPVKSLTLDKTSVSMKTGDTLKLNAVVSPAGTKVIFKTSDEKKAIVDGSGNVTAKAEGEVVITAAMENEPSVTAACKITIAKSYDPKTDTTKVLKDKSGSQIYVLVDGKYVEAKVADYYKYDTFYKKENVSEYTYTGWQNLDGKTYFFDKNGNKVTGEQVIQGAKYSFNSDGSLNTGSGVLGIDVSTWNGNIDWNKVKNSGVSYVIIRTGFRGSTQGALVEDNKFRQNIQGATNAGLKVGVYFFSQAVNEVEAVEEASMVLSQVKGYKLSYPVFIDVEPSGGRADGLSSDARTKVINAFCQTIQNGGYRAGIYANKTWLNQKMNISALSGYKIWLAQYNSTVTYGGRYDMWQYSSKGSVSGISGNVDMNLSYLSY